MICIDIILTNTGELPIYQQIVDQIKAAILRGELGADQPLPSIRVLAKELQISVITTKRAYEELEKDGLIYTMPGKGSFVAKHDDCKLEESKYQMVEDIVREAVKAGKTMGLTKSELSMIFKSVMEDE